METIELDHSLVRKKNSLEEQTTSLPPEKRELQLGEKAMWIFHGSQQGGWS